MIVIDFDDTLFDTYRYKKERFSPLSKLGITLDVAQFTYKQIRATPGIQYTNEVHAKFLGNLGYNEKEVVQVLEETAGSMIKKFVFSDAILLLEFLQTKDKNLILISLGDPIFQKQKIKDSGLEKFFVECIYPDDKKMQAIDFAVDKYGKFNWFINDKIDETGEVSKKYPHTNCVMKISAEFAPETYKNSGVPSFHTLTEILNYTKQYGQE